MKNNLEAGLWINGFDGIGELLSLHTLYVEEFHQNHSQGMGIGDDYFTRACYKLFCDVDGTLRKRSHFKDCNADYCDELSAESKKMVNKLIEDNPENYKRYQKVKSKKIITEKTELWLHLDSEIRHKVAAEFDSFKSSKIGTFTYLDVIEHMSGSVKEFVLNPYSFSDQYEPSNFLMSLINPGIEIQDKRQVFSSLRYFLRG